MIRGQSNQQQFTPFFLTTSVDTDATRSFFVNDAITRTLHIALESRAYPKALASVISQRRRDIQ